MARRTHINGENNYEKAGTHTRMHHTLIHTHTLRQPNSYTHSLLLTHSRTNRHSSIHTLVHTDTRTHTHTSNHSDTRPLTHLYTQTLLYKDPFNWLHRSCDPADVPWITVPLHSWTSLVLEKNEQVESRTKNLCPWDELCSSCLCCRPKFLLVKHEFLAYLLFKVIYCCRSFSWWIIII